MCQFVGASKNEKLIAELLRKNNWDLNSAVEEYYSKGYGEKAQVSKVDPKKILLTFNAYKDPGTGKMEDEGIAKFFSDLGINAASDIVTLLISYYMKAESMGQFSQKELQQGMSKLGASTIDDLRKKLPQLYAELKDPSIFKDLYKFVFEFATETGFKTVSVDTACGLWELMLSERCKFIDDWIDFIQTDKKDQVAISKDTWTMLLELIEQTKGDFNNFVDDGAWPSMIDQFNEYYQKKYKK